MIKKLLTKAGVIVGLFAVTAGITFAAFSLTKAVSTGNTVSAAAAASPNLVVTASPINMTGLQPGGQTANSALTIQNTGDVAGTLTLNIINASGGLCGDLTLKISGDRTGQATTQGGYLINLGSIAVGQTLNLQQAVALAANSTHLGQTCTWDESVTISGN